MIADLCPLLQGGHTQMFKAGVYTKKIFKNCKTRGGTSLEHQTIFLYTLCIRVTQPTSSTRLRRPVLRLWLWLEGGQGSDAAFQAHLLEELQDFPWGKKAARLLNYLRLKEVIGPDTDHLDGIPLIDVLRYVSTSDPPPSGPGQVARRRRPQQEKILRVLRKLKLVRGLQIPAAYLPNKSAAAVFWKGG